MSLQRPRPGRRLRASIRDWKEKGTDVNLATMLLVDAYNHDSDEAMVLSGDSDLEMPVRMTVGLPPVTVVNPVPGRRSKELQAAATSYTTLSIAILAGNQLPRVVALAESRQVTKPAAW
ncbi:MAG: NYN domain-containing protein [Candidatus Dormibacteraceae bacterium]